MDDFSQRSLDSEKDYRIKHVTVHYKMLCNISSMLKVVNVLHFHCLGVFLLYSQKVKGGGDVSTSHKEQELFLSFD